MGRNLKTAFFVAASLSALCPPAHAEQIVITQGGTYTYDHTVTNPDGDCIVVSASNVTISNSTIGPCGGIGVSAERLSNLSVTGNRFVGPMTGGVYCDTCQTVKVVSNDFRDMRMGDSARGQFVQFNNVTGPGSAVQNNTGGNVVGSDPEDLVSMYQSSGTSASHIDISGNCFKSPVGAWTSESGSGIMVGDGGGSYIDVHDNVLVNPGQVGIGVAGGDHITVCKNKVFGAKQPLSNNGFYVWNQSGSPCNTITVLDNQVDWTTSAGGKNAGWNGGGCGTITGWANNNFDASLPNLTCPTSPPPPPPPPLTCPTGSTPPPPSECALPWGGTLASGSNVKAYKAASVVAPAKCVSQTRTCSNAVLSGSYGFQSCTVKPRR